MELLQTTISILCLLNPQVPSNQELYEHLMAHKTENVAIKTLDNYKPIFVFDFTSDIIDNSKLIVDFDSCEHVSPLIKSYFLKNASLKKELYLALYSLDSYKKNTSEVVSYLVDKLSKLIKYTMPSSTHFNNTIISKAWSISKSADNKQRIVLNLFFNSVKEIEKFLSTLTESRDENFFREVFNVSTISFSKLPFRCCYYLNYDKKIL